MRSAFVASSLLLCATVATDAEPALRDNASALSPFDVFQDCPHCPDMVVLPLGDFLMGGDPLPPDTHGIPVTEGREYILGGPWEGPVHPVEIDMPVAIGRFEVTYDEWMVCVDAGGCTYAPSSIVPTSYGIFSAEWRHPVRYVSFFDIQEYLDWLNAIVGQDVYRLPTEAEWEYAARAGTTTLFAYGNDLTWEEANFWSGIDGEMRFADPELPGQLRPIAVDLLRPNPWGLHHMAGNVRERTMSCYTERHLGLSTSSAYLAHARSLPSCMRALRDGPFVGTKEWSRPQSRFPSLEDGRTGSAGFRVVRELD